MELKGLKFHQRTEGELKIKSFFCQKCGREYIGSITNEEIRADIRAIEGQRKIISVMRKKKLREKSIEKSIEEMEDLRETTLEKIHQLRLAYENGGENGSARENKVETRNPESLQNPPHH